MDHVAIDIGGRESQICIRSPSGSVKEKREATIKLKEFFAEISPSRVIVETCAESFALAAQAKDAGHDVRIVPATLVRTLGVGRRGIKTDQRDARCLAEASARVDLPSVHIPAKVSREMKTACAMRDGLVRSRTMLINTVKGWMRGELIKMRGGASNTTGQRLREHCASQNIEIPTYVMRQLSAIESLNTEIENADLELDVISSSNADCKLLMTIPGVGPVTAVRFVATVDEISRFPDAHNLESYFGLTAGESSSSESVHRTSLTKAGSKMIRWLLVQAAWSAFRTRPFDPMVLWAKQIAKRGGTRVAISALARKIAGIMFAMLRDRSAYKPSRASTVRLEASNELPTIVATGHRVVEIARSSSPSSEAPVLRTRPKHQPPTHARLRGRREHPQLARLRRRKHRKGAGDLARPLRPAPTCLRCSSNLARRSTRVPGRKRPTRRRMCRCPSRRGVDRNRPARNAHNHDR